MVDESGNYPYNPMKTVQNSYDQTRTRQLNLNTYLTWDIISSSLSNDCSNVFAMLPLPQ